MLIKAKRITCPHCKEHSYQFEEEIHDCPHCGKIMPDENSISFQVNVTLNQLTGSAWADVPEGI